MEGSDEGKRRICDEIGEVMASTAQRAWHALFTTESPMPPPRPGPPRVTDDYGVRGRKVRSQSGHPAKITRSQFGNPVRYQFGP